MGFKDGSSRVQSLTSEAERESQSAALELARRLEQTGDVRVGVTDDVKFNAEPLRRHYSFCVFCRGVPNQFSEDGKTYTSQGREQILCLVDISYVLNNDMTNTLLQLTIHPNNYEPVIKKVVSTIDEAEDYIGALYGRLKQQRSRPA